MSDYYDLASIYANNPYAASTYATSSYASRSSGVDAGWNSTTVYADSDEANNTLSFQDMLLLLVTQLQNQTIDDTMDTSDMMNQIIQMTVMQAITSMKSSVDKMQAAVDNLTESNLMSYAASLVGQTVTVALLDKEGNVVGEKVGVVTATGTLKGQHVIFIDGECYYLNQLLAVGTLPGNGTESPDPSEGEDPGDDVIEGTGPGEVPGEDFDSDFGVTNPDDEVIDPDDGITDPDDSTVENAGAGATEALG